MTRQLTFVLSVVAATTLLGCATQTVAPELRVDGTAAPVPIAAQQQQPEIPIEVDTVMIRQALVILKIQGTVLRKHPDGSLQPLETGMSIERGDVIVIRKGASLSGAGLMFAPHPFEDQWYRFE